MSSYESAAFDVDGPLGPLLPGFLDTPDGQQSTGSLINDKPAVVFFFGGAWCRPTQSFSRKLARCYNNGLRNGVEVIYCSIAEGTSGRREFDWEPTQEEYSLFEESIANGGAWDADAGKHEAMPWPVVPFYCKRPAVDPDAFANSPPEGYEGCSYEKYCWSVRHMGHGNQYYRNALCDHGGENLSAETGGLLANGAARHGGGMRCTPSLVVVERETGRIIKMEGADDMNPYNPDETLAAWGIIDGGIPAELVSDLEKVKFEKTLNDAREAQKLYSQYAPAMLRITSQRDFLLSGFNGDERMTDWVDAFCGDYHLLPPSAEPRGNKPTDGYPSYFSICPKSGYNRVIVYIDNHDIIDKMVMDGTCTLEEVMTADTAAYEDANYWLKWTCESLKINDGKTWKWEVCSNSGITRSTEFLPFRPELWWGTGQFNPDAAIVDELDTFTAEELNSPIDFSQLSGAEERKRYESLRCPGPFNFEYID